MNSLIINLSAIILKIISLTCRHCHLGTTPEQALSQIGASNYLAAFWHQNTAATLFCFHQRPHIGMASLSKDGEIASKIIEKFGFKMCRGSASRGGNKALLEMIRIINSEKMPGALTVDGPRGPIHKVKHGIIELAKQTATPIIPVCAIASRCYIFHRSWDRFRLPLPFATLYSAIGTPISVPIDCPKEQFEQFAQQLGTQLQELEVRLVTHFSLSI